MLYHKTDYCITIIKSVVSPILVHYLAVEPVAGCPHDVDTTWGIAWPNTPQGSSSVQICPGNLNSVGMWLMQ